jgi:hypothetical protein
MSWQQLGAKGRLLQAGLPPCAALGHAVGAQGGRPPRGIWRFEALDTPATIIAYYETTVVQSGWKAEKKKNGILLEKAGRRMAIWTERQGDKDQVIFQRLP